MLKNFSLFSLRHIFQDRNGIVRLQLTDALCNGLGRQLVEYLFAYRIIHFCESGIVEMESKQFNQPRPLLRLKRFDKRTHVGFMQLADHFAQTGFICGLYLAGNALDEGLAYRTVLVARQLRSIGTVHLFLVEHIGVCRHCTEDATLVRPLPSDGQTISAKIRKLSLPIK